MKICSRKRPFHLKGPFLLYGVVVLVVGDQWQRIGGYDGPVDPGGILAGGLSVKSSGNLKFF